jgi:hypothetical protein
MRVRSALSERKQRPAREGAIEPAPHFVSFQGIGAFAFEALKGALSLAVRRERQSQRCPAFGASRSFRLAHTTILSMVRTSVKLKRPAQTRTRSATPAAQRKVQLLAGRGRYQVTRRVLLSVTLCCDAFSG